MPKKSALFLDRDGVINRHSTHGFVAQVSHWQWLPSVESIATAIKSVQAMGALVFVVTNQSGVGKGLYSEAQMHAVHDNMRTELKALGADIDDLRCSLYHPEATNPKYQTQPDWRKPAPGMILDLANHYGLDLPKSLMVGDKETDRQAAQNAGCQFAMRGPRDLLDDLQNWILASS